MAHRQDRNGVTQDFDFASRAIAIREALGITQEEMATRLGIAPRTYQRIESGEGEKLQRESLRAYVNLGVNLNWLLTGDGTIFNSPNVGQLEETTPEIMGLLIQARRVLMSGNEVATRALRHNIIYFDRAIEAERQADTLRHEIEESHRRQAEMETILTAMSERLAEVERDLRKKRSARTQIPSEEENSGESEAI